MTKILLASIGLTVLATVGALAQENIDATTEEWRCFSPSDYQMLSILDKSFPEEKVLVRLTRVTENGEVSVAGVTYRAVFRVVGFDRRWDFGEDGNYAFVIKPDGSGAYYDFSSVEDGGKTRPSQTYGCVSP